MNRNPLVLVVEDESALLQVIVDKLKLSGIETLSCVSPDQCLDYMANLKELPDAIWLDYYLSSTTNALQLLSKIKSNDLWKNIPVIVVSNSASKDKIQAMLALGVKKYVVKAEYKLSDLVQLFRELVEV